MNHALAGAQLLAAWSIKFNIAWPRLILAAFVLACIFYAAVWLGQKQSNQNKKK